MADQADSVKSEARFVHLISFPVGFINGDQAMMERVVAWSNSRETRDRAFVSRFQGDAAAFQGRLKQARELDRRAVELLASHGNGELAATFRAREAMTEVLYGNLTEGRRGANEALGMHPGRDARLWAAWAFAAAGDGAEAQKLAAALGKESPEDTLVNALWLPGVRAEMELVAGRPDRTVELLHSASPYELSPRNGLRAVYTRGEAYLKTKQPNLAAAEFQKILDHRGLAAIGPTYPLAHLGLARAYTLSNDKEKSRTAYQDFLALWKDADPDIPVLKEAKAEYAKLQ